MFIAGLNRKINEEVLRLPEPLRLDSMKFQDVLWYIPTATGVARVAHKHGFPNVLAEPTLTVPGEILGLQFNCILAAEANDVLKNGGLGVVCFA
jgi:hypothetical protein